MLPLELELMSYTAFASALVDPTHATPPIVTGPAGKSAAKRYNIYRNNVTVSLINALAAVYPAVQRLTGVDFFRAMARFHIRATPPTSPLLFEYGRDFPAFIETYEYARDLPWLADVARIERAWLDAYHAADTVPLSADALALVPPQRLADVVFTAHPAAAIVRSPFAAVTIFAANRGERAPDQIDAGTPEDALITRPELDVIVRHLPEGGAVFLTSLMSGQTLGLAAASALQSSASFDIASNIAGMIEAGVFTSFLHQSILEEHDGHRSALWRG
ncbi:DNA-binding domain-containing protein [Bradyrhizobium sp. STM 3557]|uniref:HvfC/BufC N-terminal domain-containing protein n=1 Tax=Bradyrhizobium sp. STM 3557 TaxID=578920 RepID=UPI00388D42F3